MTKISFRILLVLSLLVRPIVATGMGQVIVDDVVAGFETSVRLTGLGSSQSVSLHVISPSGEDTVIPIATDASGFAMTSIPARLTEDAGTYRIFGVTGQAMVTADTTFSVLSTRVDPRMSGIHVDNAVIPADGRTSATITVTLLDARGNPLGDRPVQIVGSRTQDVISPVAGRETDGTGRVQFALQAQTAGEISIRAMDLLSGTMLDHVAHVYAQAPNVGGFTGNNYTVQLTETASAKTYDVIHHFTVLTSVPSLKTQDVLPLLTIRAEDQNGNVVESFVGTVGITTPNDPQSTLPGLLANRGEATFTGKNRGIVTIPWSVSFRKTGLQQIIVTDESGTIRGETSITVTSGASATAASTIVMETPRDGDSVPRSIVLKGKGPAFANLNVWITDASTPPEQVTEGAPVAQGETDVTGAFSFAVQLPDLQDVMLVIQDESNQNSSGILRLTVDSSGPDIATSFDPPEPLEGEAVTLTVTTESGLRDMTLRIADQTYALTEGIPGRYQVPFPAPTKGTYDYVITARDAIDNVTDVEGTLTVIGPTIPQVQNVRTEATPGGILLTWDEIPDDSITGYRIEGKTAGDGVSLQLDTPEPTDSAEIRDVLAGIDYFLTVRALRGDEQGLRSAVVTGRSLGMELTVTPQERSLLLQWTFPDVTPLANFLLEYGSPEGEYSESRTLEGGMRAFTLNDLLAQPYLLRLTPIAVNGTILTELAVTGQGVPIASGTFHASADDFTRPSDVSPGNLHGGAPTITDSGFAGSLPWLFAMAIVPIGLYWYRRRKMMQEMEVFLRSMHRRYHI